MIDPSHGKVFRVHGDVHVAEDSRHRASAPDRSLGREDIEDVVVGAQEQL